ALVEIRLLGAGCEHRRDGHGNHPSGDSTDGSTRTIEGWHVSLALQTARRGYVSNCSRHRGSRTSRATRPRLLADAPAIVCVRVGNRKARRESVAEALTSLSPRAQVPGPGTCLGPLVRAQPQLLPGARPRRPARPPLMVARSAPV